MKTYEFHYGDYQKGRTFFIFAVSFWAAVLMMTADQAIRRGSSPVIPLVFTTAVLVLVLIFLLPAFVRKQVYKGKAEIGDSFVKITRGKEVHTYSFASIQKYEVQKVKGWFGRNVVGYRIAMAVNGRSVLMDTRCDRKAEDFSGTELYPFFKDLQESLEAYYENKIDAEAEI